jgi:hypothetical protein
MGSPSPAINLGLELPEKRFKGDLIALHEPPEEFAIQLVSHRPLLCFTCTILERFQVIFQTHLQQLS